jgi:predicted phosphodiesterase
MRVAIFSDVHGNLTAFEAVLNHIKTQEPDLIFFAGDLCVFGARPKECLELLRDEGIPSVHGNTDRYVTNRPLLADDVAAEERKRSKSVDDIIDWTWASLEEMDRAYLYAFPFHRRVSPSVQPQDDLFIVHANPRDVEQPIHPNEAVQRSLYDEVKQPDNDDDLRHLLSDLDTGVMAFGHVHIPNIRYWGDITLANISSVSLPLDGDGRAKYGLFTWDEAGGWAIEHQYVEYDIDKERQVLKEKRPPNWQSLSQQLG